MTSPQNELGDSAKGFALALAAYLLWGALPIYLKALGHVPLPEILAHRVIWSVPVAFLALLILGRLQDLRAALRSPRMLAMAALTAILISLNWGIYLYAILSDQVIAGALGYYINPIFSVFLAAIVLKERLSWLQWCAIALVILAVALLTWEAGRLPLISLGLTLSFGFYALFKRALPIGPNQGFTLEVLILCPVALAYLAWLAAQGELRFGTTGTADILLLIGAGVITAVPLMLYANGAKLLRLTTIALMQYITPTLVFLLAIFVFHEPFEGMKLVAFPIIWAALALYSFDVLRRRR